MPRGNPSRERAKPPKERSQDEGPRSKARRKPRVVRIHCGHPRLRLDRRAVAAAIRLLDAHAMEIVDPPVSPVQSEIGNQKSEIPGVPPGELSLAFLTDAALARLHTAFLKNPAPTDVITFAGAPGSGQAGEICVSVDAARAFAAKHGRDFSAELTLYLVHGWLHLAGHDDLDPAKKRHMRAAEARAMAMLRKFRAIPPFSLERGTRC